MNSILYYISFHVCQGKYLGFFLLKPKLLLSNLSHLEQCVAWRILLLLIAVS